jgi:hypothetical protein
LGRGPRRASRPVVAGDVRDLAYMGVIRRQLPSISKQPHGPEVAVVAGL